MITFDFETTNLDYGSALNADNRILIVSWKLDNGPVRTYSGDIMEAYDFLKDLRESKVACAFNAKFEQLWLLRLGIDIDAYAWHDPMLAERCVLGNKQESVALGITCQRYGLSVKDPLIDSMMKAGVCPSEMPQERLARRCRLDVATTYTLHKRILKKLADRDQIEIYRTRVNFTPVLARMEYAGMQLDKLSVIAEYNNTKARCAALEQKLDALTGGINLRSTDQLAEFLYSELKFPEKRAGKRVLRNKPSKRWPDGKPKTDSATMAWLATVAETPKQSLFIRLKQQFSKENAALSKNLEFFVGVVRERNGKFHGQFNQTVAATHRLTSSGLPITFESTGKRSSVQFQNMPRIFKSLFVPPSDNYWITECDGAQLEFRVAAFLGQDKQAMLDIADPNFDAHCRTASVMNDVAYDEFLRDFRSGSLDHKVMRQRAKADTFKPLFGGTKGTPEQEKYYQDFARRYCGVTNQQELWLSEVIASNGELIMPWGMRFQWDITERRGMWMDRRTNRPVAPQVCNYPVQNLATGEIIPIAITHLMRRCREQGLNVVFVNTVHDSVIAYVHKDDMEAYKVACGEAFTTDVYQDLWVRYGLEFNVPLGCEITWGERWGKGESIIIDDVNRR